MERYAAYFAVPGVRPWFAQRLATAGCQLLPCLFEVQDGGVTSDRKRQRVLRDFSGCSFSESGCSKSQQSQIQ